MICETRPPVIVTLTVQKRLLETEEALAPYVEASALHEAAN